MGLIRPIHPWESQGDLVTIAKRIFGNGEKRLDGVTFVKDWKIYPPVLKASVRRTDLEILDDALLNDIIRSWSGSSAYRAANNVQSKPAFVKYGDFLVLPAVVGWHTNLWLAGGSGYQEVSQGTIWQISTQQQLYNGFFLGINNRNHLIEYDSTAGVVSIKDFSGNVLFDLTIGSPDQVRDIFAIGSDFVIRQNTDPFLSSFWLLLIRPADLAAPVDTSGSSWSVCSQNENYIAYVHDGYGDYNTTTDLFLEGGWQSLVDKKAFVEFYNQYFDDESGDLVMVTKYGYLANVETPRITQNTGWQPLRTPEWGGQGWICDYDTIADPFVADAVQLQDFAEVRRTSFATVPNYHDRPFFQSHLVEFASLKVWSSGFFERPFSGSEWCFGSHYIAWNDGFFGDEHQLVPVHNDEGKFIAFVNLNGYDLTSPDWQCWEFVEV